MKTEDQEALELLRQMGRVVVPLLTPEGEARRHEQMASAVNRLVESLPARPQQRPARVRPRAWWGVAAVAASVTAFVAVRHWAQAPRAQTPSQVARVIVASGQATLSRAGSPPTRLVAQQAIEAADELRCSVGSAAELALTGAGKATVEVSEDTRVRLNQRFIGSEAAPEDWLDLEQGLVTLQVAKLPPGLVLAVHTPDARVIVHGTRFSVRVTPRPPSGTVTFVSVSEGRVEVGSRGSTLFLGPGEHWSSQDSKNAPSPVADSGAGSESHVRLPPGAADASRPARAVARRASPTALGTSSSTLAEENQLYAQAMKQASAGDIPLALASLANLIRSYPHSPLAQSARVERFRLLQQIGNSSAAAREARRYLSEYPNGFARSEARRLALQGFEEP